MLRTTIELTDPKTGAKTSVPNELQEGVRRADTLLKAELNRVAEKFDIEADWRFVPSLVFPDVLLRVKVGRGTESRTHNFLLPHTTFADSATIRQGLYSPITWLGQEMAALVEIEFDRIQRLIKEDLESFATVRGE